MSTFLVAVKDDWAAFRHRWPSYSWVDRTFILVFGLFGLAKLIFATPFEWEWVVGMFQVLLAVEIMARCKAEYQRDQNFRIAVALTKVIMDRKDATVEIVDLPDGSTSIKIDATSDRRT